MRKSIFHVGFIIFDGGILSVLLIKLATEPWTYDRVIGSLITGAITIVLAMDLTSRLDEAEGHDLIYRLMVVKNMIDRGFTLDQILRKEVPEEYFENLAGELNRIYEDLDEQSSRRPVIV